MSPIDGNHPHEDPQDFIDPKGYWADTEGHIRRSSGNRDVILQAGDKCTQAEWLYVLDSLGIGKSEIS